MKKIFVDKELADKIITYLTKYENCKIIDEEDGSKTIILDKSDITTKWE